MRRRPAHLLVALTGALVALVAAAPPAAAHVTVNPDRATKGGFVTLGFRVPNERDDAGTVKLEVTLPTDHPIRAFSVRPRPGWTFTVERTPLDEAVATEGGDQVTERVSKVTWTGGPINPGEFDEFEVSLGPLPDDVDQLVFKAVQTYADGEVVRWIEERAPGGEEPEHPAPVLTLSDAVGEDGGATAAAGPGAAPAPAGGDEVASDDEVDAARTLSVVALVVAGVALLAGLAAVGRRRPSR